MAFAIGAIDDTHWCYLDCCSRFSFCALYIYFILIDPMKILGISAFYHDSSACLIIDDNVIAAAQEERFTRIKHDPSFPSNAINFCLNSISVTPGDLDFIVFYDKPFLKFDRLLETYLAFAPKGFRSFLSSMPLWVKDKLFQRATLVKEFKRLWGERADIDTKLLFSEHHLSHAASAFFPSPFEEAAILTMDGAGEWVTTSIAIGAGNNISISKEIRFPHSLGLLYSAFTYYCGFKVNSGEYKLMGLAPYGRPIYVDLIYSHLIDVKDDGSFWLDMQYFEYCTGLKMISSKFEHLFGGPARKPESPLTQREMDLAASIQVVTEDVIVRLAKNIRNTTGLKNLCLAGGVALNCVANGRLQRENIFENIWIQPAAGDAGGALGAALAVYYLYLKNQRIVIPGIDSMKGSYLGPEYGQIQIETRLRAMGAVYEGIDSEESLMERVAIELADGKGVGWHQGRMEFGPRALGCRSILADPRSPMIQKQLNVKIKFRESFRPFAPSVLREDLPDWFDLNIDSPYMLMVADVHPSKKIESKENQDNLFGLDKLYVTRSVIPAVTHVDGSARIQTVNKNTNPRYHALIKKFKEITNCPILVNTSFNVRGEPIVESPEDAFKCFMGTDLDVLVVGNYILKKSEQDPSLLLDYRNRYQLD
jgi:carbamoyltransferase